MKENQRHENSAPVHPDEELAHIIVDSRTGATGTVADWVNAFTAAWLAPAALADPLVALLSEDVILRGPIKPPVTHGKEAARVGFEKAFKGLPDLHAEVHRWAAEGDCVFIEMTFHATIGGKPTKWWNVDRVLFKGGAAVERVAYFDPSKLRNALTSSLGGIRQLWRIRRG